MKQIFRFLYALFSLFILAALLTGILSPYIDPAYFWPAALMGLAFPLIWLTNLGNLFLSVFLSRKIFIITAIYLIAGIPFMLRYFSWGSRSDCKDNAVNLKVISFNVKYFDGFEGKDKTEAQLYAHNFLNKQKADIICFQEYPMKGKRHAPFFDHVKDSLHLNFTHFSNYDPEAKSTSAILLTASKYKIFNYGIHYSPDNEIFAIYSDILVKKDTLRVFNIHLQSVKLIQEKEILRPGKETLSGDSGLKHLISSFSKLKRAFIERSYQAGILSDAITSSPHKVILAGDFNDTPGSYAYHKIGSSLRDAARAKGRGFQRTYNESYYPLRIDHIMADRSLSICSYKRFDIRMSDHYPIMAVVGLGKKKEVGSR